MKDFHFEFSHSFTHSVQYKEGYRPKQKSEKADLEKITREEYTLDWSQSKVFLVFRLSSS